MKRDRGLIRINFLRFPSIIHFLKKKKKTKKKNETLNTPRYFPFLLSLRVSPFSFYTSPLSRRTKIEKRTLFSNTSPSFLFSSFFKQPILYLFLFLFLSHTHTHTQRTLSLYFTPSHGSSKVLHKFYTTKRDISFFYVTCER